MEEDDDPCRLLKQNVCKTAIELCYASRRSESQIATNKPGDELVLQSSHRPVERQGCEGGCLSVYKHIS